MPRAASSSSGSTAGSTSTGSGRVAPADSSIMLTMNTPTVMYGVNGAKAMTENATAKSTALRTIPRPGRAAVQSRAFSRSGSFA